MKRLLPILVLTSLPLFPLAQDYFHYIYEAESKHRTGALETAISLYNKAQASAPLLPDDAYNLSCIYAQQKDSVHAVSLLTQALNEGYGNADYLQMEPTLANLHSLPIWKQLVQKARENDDRLLERMQQVEKEESYDIHKVFTPEQLKADVALLRKAMEEAHPGMYWYTDRATFDSAWNSLLQQCSRPQSVTSFYYQLWRTVNLVRDVHSETTLPRSVNQQFMATGRFFPVPVKFINHHCYVNLKEGSRYPLHFGDEILSMDGHPVKEIETRLHELILADGYATTGKQRVLNRYFYKHYTLAFQPGERVSVTYKDAYGKIRTASIPTLHKSGVDSVYSLRYLELADSVAGRFYYTPEGLPLLKINTFNADNFSNSKINYYAFLDSAFTTLKNHQDRQLIIDLRQNNGGNEQLLQELLGYLLDKPWQPYISAHVQTREFSFLEHTDNYTTNTADRIKAEFQPDSTGRLVRKPDWAGFSSVKPNRFDGQLAVLIGGLDVSAGSTFPSLLYQNREQAVFVGEETGGGFYGNNSSYYLVLTLPNTKIHCKIPLVQLRLNVKGMPFGHGLQPQYGVQETMSDLKMGNDPALQKAIELLRQQ